MAAKVTRMRPKRHDTICESLQLWLDLPLGLKPETRDDLADALGRFAPPESWSFAMLNPDQQRLVLKAIGDGPRPLVTLKVWNAAISHIRYDTGEIMAGRERLAQDVDVTPEHVSRALSRLTEIGALLKLRPGRYAINPHVGWTGSLVKRQEAAKDASELRLIEP
jgi:DNA-binding transcriptional ArsR family regulator